MNCIVRHKDADMSFQMRCVAVESERVFGDVIVTQQTPKLIPRNIYPDDVPLICGRRDRNQAHEILEAPDFMAMNRRRVFRHRRSVPVPEILEKRPVTVRRYKSMDETQKQNVAPVNCNANNEVQMLSGHTKQRKEYPSPLMGASYKCQEVVVSSLVDQLLLDIYGLPGGERGRSESESTASSVRLPPQPDYLQRKRLVVKTIVELRILVETLREHVNHAGALLIRQLRRKDHLVAKRDKQYDVITAHLQALSEKRNRDQLYTSYSLRLKVSLYRSWRNSAVRYIEQWITGLKFRRVVLYAYANGIHVYNTLTVCQKRSISPIPD